MRSIGDLHKLVRNLLPFSNRKSLHIDSPSNMIKCSFHAKAGSSVTVLLGTPGGPSHFVCNGAVPGLEGVMETY